MIFPVDFVIMTMEDNTVITVFLGRPFLAKGEALIDMENGEILLRVGKDEIKFNMAESMRHMNEFEQEDIKMVEPTVDTFTPQHYTNALE